MAKQLSACPFTRDEGGKIGWIDNTSSSRATEPRPTTTSPELSYSQLLPHDIIAKLIELQPKAGDVHIVGPSLTTQQYHVIRVEELYIPTHNILVPTQTTTLKALTTASNQNTATGGTNKKLGSFTGVNAKIPRNKLKGHGVMPTVPNFEMRGAKTTPQQPHVDTSRTSTPPQPQQSQRQRTYAIQTNGCQMNGKLYYLLARRIFVSCSCSYSCSYSCYFTPHRILFHVYFHIYMFMNSISEFHFHCIPQLPIPNG